MINIFHISDLHFGKSKTRTLKAQRLLRKIERFFHVTTEPNNCIIVTGDITNDGAPEQYKIALEALLPFKGKIYFVPGNHDYGAIGFVYDEKRARYFDERFAKELDPGQVFFEKIPFIHPLTESDKNGVSLIGLNSCFKRPSKKRLAASLGMIGHRQLRAVEDFLKKNENKAAPKILYLHHIPHEPAKEYWMDLLDWEELVDVAKGRVNLLAYGHSGRMTDPKDAGLRAKVASAREMKVRTAQRDGFEYILDANDSVEDQSCYRITIENNALHRPVKETLKK